MALGVLREEQPPEVQRVVVLLLVVLQEEQPLGGSTGGGSTGGSSGGTTTGVLREEHLMVEQQVGKIDCNEEFAEYPNISECQTDVIGDGDILELSTVGGTNHFNSTIYNSSGWYCSPMYPNAYGGF